MLNKIINNTQNNLGGKRKYSTEELFVAYTCSTSLCWLQHNHPQDNHPPEISEIYKGYIQICAL